MSLPELYNDAQRKARKMHRCIECDSPIEKGEKYHDISGKWDGQFESVKIHNDCYEFAEMLNDDYPDVEWEFGNLSETIEYCLPEKVVDPFRKEYSWTKDILIKMKARYEFSKL